MPLPTNISTGQVVGQFIVGIRDGADGDHEPDSIPASGRVSFTASVPYLVDLTATPNPVTIMVTTVEGVLDSEGYLCTPVPNTFEPAYRGVRLIATDDPDLSVTDWTWTATYSFTSPGGAPASHSFSMASDGTIDLTTVVRIPASDGIGIEQAEALAASAHAAAVEAAESAAAAAEAALEAAGAAQVTDADISALVANPASATAIEVTGLVADAAANKLNVDDALNTYQSQASLDAAAAAKVTTDGTATNTAVKAIADAAAGPKLSATDAAATYRRKDEGAIDVAPPAAGTTAYQVFANAVAAARTRGVRKLRVAAGTYTFDQSLLIDNIASLEIECDEGAVLDFSTAPTLVEGCIVAKGGANTALPALGASISRDGTTITFATAPAVAPKDLIVILNNADYSWSSYRDYYRRGEIARVASVTGNVVTVDAPIHDSYLTTEPISLTKMNPISFKFKGGKVIGKTESLYESIIRVQRGYRCSIENVATENASYAHVSLIACYDSFVEKLWCLDYSPNIATNYGVAVVNCQKITLDKVHARTTRHAITLTGGGTDSQIVCRDVNVYNSQLAGTFLGLDMHGNVEKCGFYGNTIYGGVHLAGDNTITRGNRIYGHITDGTDDGVAIKLNDLKGCSHIIDDNEIFQVNNASAAIIATIATAVDGGNFKVNRNSLHIGGYTCTFAVQLKISGGMTQSPTVEIKNNSISKDGVEPRLSVEGYAGHTYAHVTISGNRGAAVRAAGGNYALLSINDNETIKAENDGIVVTTSANLLAGEVISIKRNIVLNAGDTGIRVVGTAASTVIIEGNTPLNANQRNAVSTNQKSSVYVDTAKVLIFKDNVWGDTQATPTQVRLYAALNSPDFVFINNVRIGSATPTIVETSVTKRTA